MAQIKWHRIIKADKSKLEDFIDFFEKEIEDARKEVVAKGNLETVTKNIPYYHDMRFSQLQQVETVLEVLELELKELRSEKFQLFLESYKRALTSNDCMKYVDGEKEVVALSGIINEVRFVRNQLLGIVDSLSKLGFALGHVIRLRTAGLEDARLE